MLDNILLWGPTALRRQDPSSAVDRSDQRVAAGLRQGAGGQPGSREWPGSARECGTARVPGCGTSSRLGTSARPLRITRLTGMNAQGSLLALAAHGKKGHFSRTAGAPRCLPRLSQDSGSLATRSRGQRSAIFVTRHGLPGLPRLRWSPRHFYVCRARRLRGRGPRAPVLPGLSRQHCGPGHDHVGSAAYKLRKPHEKRNHARFCRGLGAGAASLLPHGPHGHRAPLRPSGSGC